jgi:hypothetical protein
MPILGVIASAITGNLASPSYESIATVSVGSGGQANIEFTSIPSTYKHLQVRGITFGTAAPSGSMSYQMNSDTSSNYVSHLLGGNGSVATSFAVNSGNTETSARFYGYYDNLSNTNYPLAFVMDILDYSNTNKYKTVRTLSGMDKNGNNYGEIFLYSSFWKSTSAVTSLKLFCGGQDLGQYTQFALYGMKGA